MPVSDGKPIRHLRAGGKLQSEDLRFYLIAALGCACVVAVVLLANAFMTSRGGTALASADGASETATVQSEGLAETIMTEQASYTVPEQPAVDPAPLTPILGEELTAKLLTSASVSEEANWIASHPEAYAGDGERVQFKLLRLAANEPAALEFVRNFPDSYPAQAASGSTADPAPGLVPHLYQWDPRWGYTEYSSTTFSVTGCGPTAFAMVYQGLTGHGDLSPYDMAVRAREDGCMDEYGGTYAEFFYDEAARSGIVAEGIPSSAESLRAALSEGKLVIVNVGPGDFTDGGHYIVARGLDDAGKVLVNDPFSVERSGRAWDPETIASQSKLMISFRLA